MPDNIHSTKKSKLAAMKYLVDKRPKEYRLVVEKSVGVSFAGVYTDTIVYLLREMPYLLPVERVILYFRNPKGD